MPTILGANTLSSGGFQVDNSVRFNGVDSPALKRDSMGTASNRKKFTLSMWMKRSTIDQRMFASFDGANSYFQFQSGGQLEINDVPGSSFNYRFVTNAVYKDVTAWMHVVVAFDSTQSTNTNRLKLFVNGVEPSLGTATYPDQNFTPDANSTGSHKYGSYDDSADYAFNGYFAEIVFIDGTAYAPTDFGEFDEDSGIWKPIDPSGLTFGTNGHYLDFKASGNLGNDANGGTDFDENNIVAADQATDTCTNNFCTMNSLIPTTNATFSEGNCKLAIGGSSIQGAGIGTFGLTTGKWYWEIKLLADKDNHTHGVISELTEELYTNVTAIQNDGGVTSWINGDGGEVVVDGSASTADYGIMAENSIMGIALDLDNFKITYLDDNSALVSNFNLSAERGTIFPLIKMGINCTAEVNFGGCSAFAVSSANSDADGHGNFEHAPPSGYFAICTKNLAEYG